MIKTTHSKINERKPTAIPDHKIKSLKTALNSVGLVIRKNTSENIEITCTKSLPFLPELEILLSSEIINKRIVTSAKILQNGTPYVVNIQSRISQIIEFLNSLSDIIRYGSIYIHPQNGTIQFNIARSINFHMTLAQFATQIHEQLEKIYSYTRFNIYCIMYLSGQTDQTMFQMLKDKGIIHRQIGYGVSQKLQNIINDLIQSKRNNNLIMQTKQIDEFNAYEVKPQNMNQEQDNRTVSRKAQNTSIHLKPYLNELKQVAYPAQRQETEEVYSQIIFSKKSNGEDDVNWTLFVETSNVKIYKSRAKFYFPEKIKKDFNRTKPVESDYISKFIVRKVVTKQSLDSLECQKQMLKLMANYSSVYIAKFYSVADRKREYQNSILLDLYSESAASTYLKDNARSLSLRTKMLLMPHILQGTRFLRDLGIAHLDLKFENVLVGRGLVCRLADFGESQLVNSNQENSGYTLPFTSPQFLNHQRISSDMDTYALGIMTDFLYIKSNILPVRKQNTQNLTQSIRNKMYPNLLSFCPEKYLKIFPSKTIAKIMMTVMLLCLHPNPLKRPNQDIICILFKQIQKQSDFFFKP